jgi:uncharacterized protein (TIGR03118 family)
MLPRQREINMLRFRALLSPKLTMLMVPLVLPSIVSAEFIQTNLVSDVSGLATFTDPNLKNPWGLSASAGSPFWVSDQGTGRSTLYGSSGTPNALVVTVPGTGATPPQGPTGQVFNTTASSFQVTGGKANFLFATLGGTIDGWNSGTTAAVAFTSTDQASYTGLALGTVGSNNFLYAADFAHGKIDVVNSTFAKTTLAGNFADPSLPAGYSPYNIQNIGGKMYVEYALVDSTTHRASTNANTGFVSVFDTNGNFLLRLVTSNHLDSPWGVALAPLGFGELGGDLLVGNFGDGTISAFDPVTGAFAGVITTIAGAPIVNSGLWGISFHAAGAGFDPNTLYFNAGINNEANGLFGTIQPTPEPATLGLIAAGAGVGLLFRRRLTAR